MADSDFITEKQAKALVTKINTSLGNRTASTVDFAASYTGSGSGGGATTTALGSFDNPYLNPGDPSTLPGGAYYIQFDSASDSTVTLRRRPTAGVTSVTATAPHFVDIGRKVSIPSVPGVEYLVDGSVATSTTTVNAATTTVTARASGGGALSGQTSWTYTYPEFNWFPCPRVNLNAKEWSIGGGGTMALISNATGFSHGTTTCVQQTSSGAETWLIYSRSDYFPMPTGPYVLRFEMKRPVAARTDVVVTWYDVNDVVAGTQQTSINGTAGTQWVSVNINKPATATRLRFLIDCYGSSAGEVIQATNFSITKSGVFFDGDTADTSTVDNTWESTPSIGYSRSGAKKDRLFDSDFANAGFGNYFRLAPTWIEEGTDYGLVYDDQLGTTVAWLDSARRPTLGNNYPRVGIDAPDNVLAAAHGNTDDVYWVGFSFYMPSTHPLTTADGWCTLSTGGFGPPWGGSSKTGMAIVRNATNTKHVLSIGADGQLVTEFPLDTWINIVMGYKFSYTGWLELYKSEGADNTNLVNIPYQGQTRRYVDTLTAGGNDGWVNDPTLRASCTGLSAYGSQPCRILFARHRLARTMDKALPFGD